MNANTHSDDDLSATDRLVNALDDEGDIENPTAEDAYEHAEHDSTDADGNYIIRFVGDREGGVSFEVSDSDLFRDFYAPDRVMMERFGLSEGVRKALDHLENMADLRSVGEYRYGSFNLDRETGRTVLEEFTRITDSGVAVVAVTHDPQVREYTDRTVDMLDGELQP